MIHSDTTSGNNSDNPRETLEEGSREKETILVMIGRHSVGKSDIQRLLWNQCNYGNAKQLNSIWWTGVNGLSQYRMEMELMDGEGG